MASIVTVALIYDLRLGCLFEMKSAEDYRNRAIQEFMNFISFANQGQHATAAMFARKCGEAILHAWYLEEIGPLPPHQHKEKSYFRGRLEELRKKFGKKNEAYQALLKNQRAGNHAMHLSDKEYSTDDSEAIAQWLEVAGEHAGIAFAGNVGLESVSTVSIGRFLEDEFEVLTRCGFEVEVSDQDLAELKKILQNMHLEHVDFISMDLKKKIAYSIGFFTAGMYSEALQVLPADSDTSDSNEKAMIASCKARILLALGQLKEAEGVLSYAIKSRTQRDVLMAGMKCTLGDVLREFGDVQGALNAYMESQLLSIELSDVRGEARALSSIAAVRFSMGAVDQAIQDYSKALATAKQHGLQRRQASCLGGLARIERRRMNYDVAHGYLEQSLSICIQLGYSRGMAANLFDMGQTQRNQKRNQEAIDYFSEALEINESIQFVKGVESCLGAIAGIKSRIGEHNDAVEFFTRAKESAEKRGYLKGVAINSGEIARIFLRQGEFEKAIGFLDESETINRELNDAQGLATVLSMRSTLYKNWSEFEKMRSVNEELLDLNLNLGFGKGVAIAHSNLATAFQRLGDFDSAEAHLLACLDENERSGSKRDVEFTSQRLERLRQQHGV